MKYFWLLCIAITLPLSAQARFAAPIASSAATNAAIMMTIAASAAASSSNAKAEEKADVPEKCASVYERVAIGGKPGTPEQWIEKHWPDKEITTFRREGDSPFYMICHRVGE